MVTVSSSLSQLGTRRARHSMGASRSLASKLARHRDRNGRGTAGHQSQIIGQPKLNASLLHRLAPIL